MYSSYFSLLGIVRDVRVLTTRTSICSDFFGHYEKIRGLFFITCCTVHLSGLVPLRIAWTSIFELLAGGAAALLLCLIRSGSSNTIFDFFDGGPSPEDLTGKYKKIYPK